jgi:hypothetical protein
MQLLNLTIQQDDNMQCTRSGYWFHMSQSMHLSSVVKHVNQLVSQISNNLRRCTGKAT